MVALYTKRVTFDASTGNVAVIPFWSVTVMRALPFPSLRTRPALSTEAIMGSEDVYVYGGRPPQGVRLSVVLAGSIPVCM
ncbi:hypothetical protein D3C77_706490 [compost metagenome]